MTGLACSTPSYVTAWVTCNGKVLWREQTEESDRPSGFAHVGWRSNMYSPRPGDQAENVAAIIGWQMRTGTSTRWIEKVAIVVTSTLVAGAVALVVSVNLPRTYEAEATILVASASGQNGVEYTDLLAASILAETYAELATTRPLLERAIARLGLTITPGELQQQVRVISARELPTFSIIVEADAADRAAAIANALAAEVLLIAPTQDPRIAEGRRSILAELEKLNAEIATIGLQLDELAAIESPTQGETDTASRLRDRLDEVRIAQATLLGEAVAPAGEPFQVIEPAVPPDRPASPLVTLNTTIASVIGFVFGIVAAFFSASVDARWMRFRSLLGQI